MIKRVQFVYEGELDSRLSAGDADAKELTDDALKARLKAASIRTSEYVCELPLYEEYEELIKSDIADVKNSGGRGAGAITAALFLKKFIGDYPWAHLDIAGVATIKSARPTNPKPCASGYGVRLLNDIIKTNYE